MAAPLYEIVAGDIVQVTWFQRYQGSTILNVNHYRAAPSSPIADGNAAIVELLAELETKFLGGAGPGRWQDLMVDTWNLDYVQAQIIYPERRYYNFIDVNIPGEIDESGCPSNVAAVVSFSSNRAERGATGSKHFTALPNSYLEGAYWNTASLLLLQAFGNKFLETIAIGTGGNWEPIIWSAATPTTDNWPIAAQVRSTVRIMRRRTLGVGE